MESIIEKIKDGNPLFIGPYKEAKVWGIDGIGEYWYGAEKGEKSSIASVGGDNIPMDELLQEAANEVLGENVIQKFGIFLPLVKILTPKGRLSVQFHDAKNELWVVTGVEKKIIEDSDPTIVIGFSDKVISEYGKDVGSKYKAALESYGRSLNELIAKMESNGHVSMLEESGDAIIAAKKIEDDIEVKQLLEKLIESGKELDDFYNKITVKVGDVIPVSQGTLHALGSGVIVVEPQIPGPTQSLEDGATYPVRYNFPEFPAISAKKQLDLDRINEINVSKWEKGDIEVILDEGSVKVECLPGGFGEKGMEVGRITVRSGGEIAYNDIKSYHILTLIEGRAKVVTDKTEIEIPKAAPGLEMLVIPAATGSYKILAEEDAQILDIYTPV